MYWDVGKIETVFKKPHQIFHMMTPLGFMVEKFIKYLNKSVIIFYSNIYAKNIACPLLDSSTLEDPH